jgi:multiple sugar transport system permease protein
LQLQPKATTNAPTKNRSLSLRTREKIAGYIFISPWLIGFLFLTFIPLIFSLYTSFTNYDITSEMNWVGFKNYITMFTIDPLFWKALYNTTFFVVLSVPLNTIGALSLAVLLNQKVTGMRIFRTVFYLPHVLSGVAVYLLWMEILNPQTGLVNVALSWFGIHGPAWFFDPHWAKPGVILMQLWGVGGGMLLYLGSLQSVPESLYEAAELDGAGPWQRFWNITLPMITPIMFFEIVTGIIGGFQVFQQGYVMSTASGGSPGSGSPVNSLLFYNLEMWNQAFVNFKVGYANAMAWLLFAIVMVLTWLNFKLSKRWVHYEGGDQ